MTISQDDRGRLCFTGETKNEKGSWGPLPQCTSPLNEAIVYPKTIIDLDTNKVTQYLGTNLMRTLSFEFISSQLK